MRRIRTTLTTAIAIGLLAGSAVGVAAQDAEVAAPVEVTGTDVEGACPGGPSEYAAPVRHNRGFVCTHTWTMSDPRLDGTFTRAWNLDFYQDGTGLDFGYATGRLENDGGAWSGSGIQFWADSEEGYGPLSMETYTLKGEGGYEGMTVHLYSNFLDDGPPSPHGILFEAEAAPMPEPVQAS